VSGAPGLAVVVVSFEARETLLAGLDLLRTHVSLPFELVVVDNASSDGSADGARVRHPGALVVANPENVGFARACNQGWRATRAPLVLFLNPDAEVSTGAVEALVGLLEGRPDVGAAGPRTRGSDGSIQVSTGPDLAPVAELRQRRLVLGVARGEPRALAEAEAIHAREQEPGWVSGSCLLARRTALEEVGGFDERFFLYEEDADLCRRLREAGWRVVFTPAAEVKHHLGRSMSKAPRRARLEYHRSHLLYYRKHNGPLSRAALRVHLVARGCGQWLAAIASGDAEGRADAASLLQLSLGR
jgi:N-acetylglucosaminyl-diphospho-decaprenol L-rhamnosyltransferase